MKYLLLLSDGMADYPIEEIGNKTPLEYANTEAMDSLAPNALIGTAQTIPKGFPPGSDVANLSVLGYEPQKYYTGRSPLEAVSMGVTLAEQDMAFRCNLVTLSTAENYSEKVMLDYCAGEISSADAKILIDYINKQIPEFAFFAGISYRHLMLWENCPHNNFSLTAPHDILDKSIKEYLPQEEHEELLLTIMQKSFELLSQHPLNLARMEKGLNPANSIWLWGEGKKPKLDSFEKKYNLKGSVVAAVDLVFGLGICAGLNPVKVDGATGSIITNFKGKAIAAIEELRQGKDFVFLHIESPDEAGHQGDLKAKIWAIEQIDQKVVKYIISEMESFEDFRLMIVSDHPTPIALRTHTSDAVPFMIYDKKHSLLNSPSLFNENTARQGIHLNSGAELMNFFINAK